MWCASAALRPAAERSRGRSQLPSAGLPALWMMLLVAFERDQMATAFPAGATVTWGASASWPAAERSTGESQAPPAGLVALWMMVLDPFERDQTATAFPAGATVTSGSVASRPTAERATGGCQGPPAGPGAPWMGGVGASEAAPAG